MYDFRWNVTANWNVGNNTDNGSLWFRFDFHIKKTLAKFRQIFTGNIFLHIKFNFVRWCRIRCNCSKVYVSDFNCFTLAPLKQPAYSKPLRHSSLLPESPDRLPFILLIRLLCATETTPNTSVLLGWS